MVVVGELQLRLEVARSRAGPRTRNPGPPVRQKSTVSPSNVRDLDAARRRGGSAASASRMTVDPARRRPAAGSCEGWRGPRRRPGRSTRRRAIDDVEVAVGDRVERSRVDRGLHASPASSCRRCRRPSRSAGRRSAPSRRTAARARMLAARLRAGGVSRQKCLATTTPPVASDAARRAPATRHQRSGVGIRRVDEHDVVRRSGDGAVPAASASHAITSRRTTRRSGRPGAAARRFSAMTRTAPRSRSTKTAGGASRERLDPGRPAAGEQVEHRGPAQARARGSRTASASPGRRAGACRAPGAARRTPRARPGDDPACIGHRQAALAGSPSWTRRSQPSAELPRQPGLGRPALRRPRRAAARPSSGRASPAPGGRDREGRHPQAGQAALGETQHVTLAAQLEVPLRQLEPVRGGRRPPSAARARSSPRPPR